MRTGRAGYRRPTHDTKSSTQSPHAPYIYQFCFLAVCFPSSRIDRRKKETPRLPFAGRITISSVPHLSHLSPPCLPTNGEILRLFVSWPDDVFPDLGVVLLLIQGRSNGIFLSVKRYTTIRFVYTFFSREIVRKWFLLPSHSLIRRVFICVPPACSHPRWASSIAISP